MVGIMDDTCIRYPLGTRIKIGDNCGTVCYVGEVLGYQGTWLGIEWDDPKRGKHNGTIDGKHYFYTQHPTAGSFIRPGKVGPFESLEEAARERYLGYSENALDQQLLREAQESLQASFFEVVGMDKLARKQSKFEQLTDVSVDNCAVNSAGYLKEFTMLTTLNLSHTLIWNWEIVADICRQIPSLRNLNLSCNRLVVPSDLDISNLATAFDNLRFINLRECGFNNWSDVMQTALLWPYIESLSLQGNPISELSVVDTTKIFKNLKELDLHRTKLCDFDQVCKLSNIKTLEFLNLMENGIEVIKLPDCESDAKLLDIFPSLEHLNIFHNPIWNETDAFNELDKLPKLKRLNKTPHLKSDFNEMFVNAVAMISNLQVLNKAQISPEERRGAEYDIWKKYAPEWLQASMKPETLKEFYKKHRTYALMLKKYGSPAEFIPRSNAKVSNLIKIRVLHSETGDVWEKKFPRMITVQTLLGLIIKRFHMDSDTAPQLCYIDNKHPDLVVPMDNLSKTLDFYSLQENDTVLVKWQNSM
ncbi:tubulin-specific chaperone E-like [Musca vetustissima]|uniref:tubulin-specific chaperone E-like n=1 Tax=Musca vetustissima TaxID=27455 RepID=UPI002AB67902|nr:tubulin-specific chaperone E-like [Musca vetustissima]